MRSGRATRMMVITTATVTRTEVSLVSVAPPAGAYRQGLDQNRGMSARVTPGR